MELRAVPLNLLKRHVAEKRKRCVDLTLHQGPGHRPLSLRSGRRTVKPRSPPEQAAVMAAQLQTACDAGKGRITHVCHALLPVRNRNPGRLGEVFGHL